MAPVDPTKRLGALLRLKPTEARTELAVALQAAGGRIPRAAERLYACRAHPDPGRTSRRIYQGGCCATRGPRRTRAPAVTPAPTTPATGRTPAAFPDVAARTSWARAARAALSASGARIPAAPTRRTAAASARTTTCRPGRSATPSAPAAARPRTPRRTALQKKKSKKILAKLGGFGYALFCGRERRGPKREKEHR